MRLQLNRPRLNAALKSDLDAVLSKITASRKILSPTSRSSADFGYEESKWIDILESMVDCGGLSPQSKRDILERCCNSTQILTQSKFNGDLQRLYNEYQQQALTDFWVVYPVLGPVQVLPDSVRIDGCFIRFQERGSEKFIQNINDARSRQYESNVMAKAYHDDLKTCSLVVVKIAARNISDAVHFSERALRLVLGLSSFAIGYRNESFRLGGREAPIAALLIAPHITAHKKSGLLATHEDMMWHVAWEPGIRPNRLNLNTIPKHREQISRIIARYRRLKSGWKSDVTERLIEFHDAFSEPLFSNCFQKAWRLLEKLTGVEKGKSDKLLRRSKVLFGDEENARVFAEHLLFRRNQMVHQTPVLDFERHRTCIQLKMLIEPLMVEYIFNRQKFTRPCELWKMLDQTSFGLDGLDERIVELEVARKRLLNKHP